nr:immunoglobulin light chain junction region [Macaca mulatta]
DYYCASWDSSLNGVFF